MGLDMFLKKRTYIGSEYDHRKVNIEINCEINGKKVIFDSNKISNIEESAAYWRKANQIHKWFVDNIQEGKDDCGEYEVELKELQKLIKVCKEVISDKNKAGELLPTKGGFFFGNTEENEFYFRQIQKTVTMLEEAINGLTEKDYDVSFYYHSSW